MIEAKESIKYVYRDGYGNKWTNKYTLEEAKIAAQGLIDCANCIDCDRCYHCTRCTNCTNCTTCINCITCINRVDKD